MMKKTIKKDLLDWFKAHPSQFKKCCELVELDPKDPNTANKLSLEHMLEFIENNSDLGKSLLLRISDIDAITISRMCNIDIKQEINRVYKLK